MPKILLLSTADTVGGGGFIACYRHMKTLKMQNIDVRMLVNHKFSNNDSVTEFPGMQWYKKSLLYGEMLYSRYVQHDKKSANFTTGRFGQNISNHSMVHESDVLHMHWINQGFLSVKNIAQLAKTGKPLFWTLHDMWAFTGGCHHSRECMAYKAQCGNCPLLSKPHPGDISHRIWKGKNEGYGDINMTVTTPSTWLAGKARESSLFGNYRVEAIPNPIDTELFQPTAKKEENKKALGLKSNKKIITFIAQNPGNKRKGIQYLNAALIRIAKEKPDSINKFLIMIIGKIRPMEDIPFETHLTGYISGEENMAKYYNASDLFVLPSLEENLPNTIMESLSCGTPAVAFKVGGIPDMIDHQENGYLAEYKSAEDLAKGIIWALEERERYDKLSERAREKVLRHFTYEVIGKQYSNLYGEVLNSKA